MQAEVARIKGALLMRPVRKPSEFSKFASVVAKSIEELSNMIQTQHKSYLSTCEQEYYISAILTCDLADYNRVLKRVTCC
eukprot:124003-Chlamydomonas_euryale.AAC.7